MRRAKNPTAATAQSYPMRQATVHTLHLIVEGKLARVRAAKTHKGAFWLHPTNTLAQAASRRHRIWREADIIG